MAFDAGMLSCVLHEVGGELTDGKIEKIYMPQKDMAVLQIKKGREPRRLLINAGPTSPRICITAEKADKKTMLIRGVLIAVLVLLIVAAFLR